MVELAWLERIVSAALSPDELLQWLAGAATSVPVLEACSVLPQGHPITSRGAGLGCRVSPISLCSRTHHFPCAGSQPGTVGW